MQEIIVGTDFSGVGAFDQALIRLGVNYKTSFACDMDRYARNTYLLNFGTAADYQLLKTPDVKKIDDIYYRWFVNTKLKPPTEEEIKFVQENEERVANLFSFYYPWNVYSRKIPKKSLDISVHTCPCQAFSLAGKRKGEEDRRGILFYNSHEFIAKNLPRFFIFENVKGLLSDDKGKTFERWIDLLGGKTVNGNPVIFPNEESVPYHVYYKVLNAKEHGVPQNRERIFIIGIRDDEDYQFNFPKPFHLEKRLKDVLESNVPEKYFLSDKMVEGLIKTKNKSYINQDTQASQVFSENDLMQTICAGTHGYANGYVEFENEIIQLNNPKHSNDRIYSDEGISPTLNTMQGGNRQPLVEVSEDVKVVCFGRSEEEKERRRIEFQRTGKDSGSFKDKTLILKNQEYYDTLLANPNQQKEGLICIVSNTKKGYDVAEEEEDSINFSVPTSKTRRGRVGKKVSQTLDTQCNQGIYTQKRIRRLTELECFRLMDFNEDFKTKVSSTQQYKQAGNSVVVKHFEDLITKLFKL